MRHLIALLFCIVFTAVSTNCYAELTHADAAKILFPAIDDVAHGANAEVIRARKISLYGHTIKSESVLSEVDGLLRKEIGKHLDLLIDGLRSRFVQAATASQHEPLEIIRLAQEQDNRWHVMLERSEVKKLSDLLPSEVLSSRVLALETLEKIKGELTKHFKIDDSNAIHDAAGFLSEQTDLESDNLANRLISNQGQLKNSDPLGPKQIQATVIALRKIITWQALIIGISNERYLEILKEAERPQSLTEQPATAGKPEIEVKLLSQIQAITDAAKDLTQPLGTTRNFAARFLETLLKHTERIERFGPHRDIKDVSKLIEMLSDEASTITSESAGFHAATVIVRLKMIMDLIELTISKKEKENDNGFFKQVFRTVVIHAPMLGSAFGIALQYTSTDESISSLYLSGLLVSATIYSYMVWKTESRLAPPYDNRGFMGKFKYYLIHGLVDLIPGNLARRQSFFLKHQIEYLKRLQDGTLAHAAHILAPYTRPLAFRSELSPQVHRVLHANVGNCITAVAAMAPTTTHPAQ